MSRTAERSTTTKQLAAARAAEGWDPEGDDVGIRQSRLNETHS